MNWTTERPIKAGLYWAYNGVNLILVSKSDDDKWVRFAYDPQDRMDSEIFWDSDYTYFMGPLVQPDPPKDIEQ